MKSTKMNDIEQQENYTKEKITISLIWANIFAVIVFVLSVVVYGLLYSLAQGTGIQMSLSTLNFFPDLLILVLCFVIGVVVHELIHGLCWAGFTKNGFKSIKFGIMWKMITPYCHCKEPLKVKQYIFGAIMPTIILGIAPAIVAIAIGNFVLLFFSAFFTAAGSGDLLIVHALRKERMDTWVEDHPSEAGCYVYRFTEEGQK
jgi:flagellar biosynthesis protein FliQ